MGRWQALASVGWLTVTACSEYGLSRYDVSEPPLAAPGEASTGTAADDPLPGVPDDDPEPGAPAADGPPPDLCGLPGGVVLPQVGQWESETLPRTLTLWMSQGEVTLEAHAGPLTVAVDAVAPPAAGATWTGDDLVIDYLDALGGEITVWVPPGIEHIEVGVCVGSVTALDLDADLTAHVEIGDLAAEGLTSGDVVTTNPLGDTSLAFAIQPAAVEAYGADGETRITVPSASCDCDLQVSGIGVAELDGIVDDASAALEVTAQRTIGTIVVRGAP